MMREPNAVPADTLRVVTYNIHKCVGMDRRRRPERIAAVIQELEADIVCLQEVVNAPEGPPRFNQAEELAAAMPEFGWSFGVTRPLRGGTYGNMTLARFATVRWQTYDVSHARREPRGVLHTDFDLGNGRLLHVFNVHLGTSLRERRHQAQRLLSEHVLGQHGLAGPRIVIGDFNDWTAGLTTRLLRSTFESFRPRHAMRFPKTYPGVLPLVTLDHCYYEAPLKLVETRLWRSRRALVASDHLPLVAEFRWE
jgi:endonuclease/exonuclease/phosphatase family metal-dependent hydrolase